MTRRRARMPTLNARHVFHLIPSLSPKFLERNVWYHSKKCWPGPIQNQNPRPDPTRNIIKTFRSSQVKLRVLDCPHRPLTLTNITGFVWVLESPWILFCNFQALKVLEKLTLSKKGPWKPWNFWMSEMFKINMSKEFTMQLFFIQKMGENKVILFVDTYSAGRHR